MANTYDRKEWVENIFCYLDQCGINQDSFISHQNLELIYWDCVAQGILDTNVTASVIEELPTLATPEEWTFGLACITTGIALYIPPFTRPFGIWLIRTGITIIGMASLDDFRQYARDKGWLSKEDWNIFDKVLKETPTSN